MEFIAHRINTIDQLRNIPKKCGIEFDLRDHSGNIILQHDPFIKGEDFESFLKQYNHGTLILNIKSERIEFRVLELIKKYNIKNYFFLDSSFPMIDQLIKLGEDNISIRFSEYECLNTALDLKNKIKWLWGDCFNFFPINNLNYPKIKENGLKICLVSPELHNRKNEIQSYIKIIQNNNYAIDAVCSKIENHYNWSSL